MAHLWVIEVTSSLFRVSDAMRDDPWFPLAKTYPTRRAARAAAAKRRAGPQPIIMLGDGRYRVAKYERTEPAQEVAE